MNYWFTADTHFGHTNIIKYCNRPFKDVVEMNETIISNWNNFVKKGDLVYHLGDFCFGRNDLEFDMYFKRLNGLIIFIKGNHDKLAWKNRDKFYAFSDSYREIEIQGQEITLNHYAQIVWNKKHHNAWCLCGHSHYNLGATTKHGIEIGKILDVGVDGNNFTPYNFEEIKLIMNNKPTFPTINQLNDHHTR